MRVIMRVWSSAICLAIFLGNPVTVSASPDQEAGHPSQQAGQWNNQRDNHLYRAAGKRDPFQPPQSWIARITPKQPVELDEAGRDMPVKPQRSKEFLETFPIDSIKLVAILFTNQGQQAVAMVEDPEGKGHVIRRGNYLGINEGYITEILATEIIITEPLPGHHDPTARRTIMLPLHPNDEQGEGHASTGTP